MKITSLLIFFITVFSHIGFGQNQTLNCVQFKTGDFMYVDSSGISWDIKRTKKQQTERNKKDGTIIKHKITWLNDCEYKLTQVWTSDKTRRKLNRSWMIYRIIAMSGKTYQYSCTCKDGTNISGVVVKIIY